MIRNVLLVLVGVLLIVCTTAYGQLPPPTPPEEVISIDLTANPQIIETNQISTLTATIQVVEGADPVRLITFEIISGPEDVVLSNGTKEDILVTTESNESGIATVQLIAGDNTGEVVVKAYYHDKEDNVTVYIVETIPIEPDLIVEDISVTPESEVPETCDVGPAAGENVTLTVIIKNIGTSDAGSFDVALNIDGESMVKTILGLSVNESVEVQFTWTPESAGNYTVTAEIDVNNTVSELNEENNELTRQVIVLDDHVPDDLEQILGKYIDFDWRTQTPTKEDIVDAVTNAVVKYFNTDDPELRQEIVDDVTQMVNLYFSPCI